MVKCVWKVVQEVQEVLDEPERVLTADKPGVPTLHTPHQRSKCDSDSRPPAARQPMAARLSVTNYNYKLPRIKTPPLPGPPSRRLLLSLLNYYYYYIILHYTPWYPYIRVSSLTTITVTLSLVP